MLNSSRPNSSSVSRATAGVDLTLQFSVQVIHQFNLLFFKNLSSHIASLSEELQLVSTNHSACLLGKVGEAWQLWRNTSVDKMHGVFRRTQLKPSFQTINVCQQPQLLLLILFFCNNFIGEKNKKSKSPSMQWQNFTLLLSSQLEHKDLHNVT